MAQTMGIRGMLAGAIFGGVAGGIQNGPGGIVTGALGGAVAGGFGGAAFGAVRAFAGAGGLWAALTAGTTGGAAGGFAHGLGANNWDMKAALAEAEAGAWIGMAFGAAEFAIAKTFAWAWASSSSSGHILGFPRGQWFSGAYDEATGRVLLLPSSEATPPPSGFVSRRGGHRIVSQGLGGDPAGHHGFAVQTQANGSLTITWTSRTLNAGPGGQATPSVRPAIIRAVEENTGLKINQ
jgi:hypothetical protein